MSGTNESLLAEFRKVMRAENVASLLPAGMPRAGLRLGLAVGDVASAFRTVSAGFGRPRTTRTSGTQSVSAVETLKSSAFRTVTSGFGGVGLALASGFGIGSLVSGLARLFGGGGGSATPPPLVRFSLPTAVHAEMGISQGTRDRMTSVDYSSGGGIRMDPGTGSAGPPEVDGQWFLDRSDQIARAVREALLNGNSLGDVVGELG